LVHDFCHRNRHRLNRRIKSEGPRVDAACPRPDPFRPWRRRPGVGPPLERNQQMKSITIRKAGTVRLTSAAHPLYGGTCGGGGTKPIQKA
jgi:hypothetical protein